jgi:hypothetical protein
MERGVNVKVKVKVKVVMTTTDMSRLSGLIATVIISAVVLHVHTSSLWAVDLYHPRAFTLVKSRSA